MGICTEGGVLVSESGECFAEQPVPERLEFDITHLVRPYRRADRLTEQLDRPLASVTGIAAIAIKERMLKGGIVLPLLGSPSRQVGSWCPESKSAEIDGSNMATVN